MTDNDNCNSVFLVLCMWHTTNNINNNNNNNNNYYYYYYYYSNNYTCMSLMLKRGNKLGFYTKPLLIRLPVLSLTQAWQCDISIVDPTSPGVTSAHTGSAPC